MTECEIIKYLKPTSDLGHNNEHKTSLNMTTSASLHYPFGLDPNTFSKYLHLKRFMIFKNRRLLPTCKQFYKPFLFLFLRLNNNMASEIGKGWINQASWFHLVYFFPIVCNINYSNLSLTLYGFEQWPKRITIKKSQKQN